ncbi:MAG: hypothetical protein U9R32_06935 [Bacteroidota bacterium]|nr:hypothetical protein [Bacteroidota bacterium]
MGKKYIILLIQLVIFSTVYSGETVEAGKREKITYSLDLVSTHLWRGSSSGTAPCIEPAINYHPTKNLTLTGWAAYSVDESYSELDFIASYQLKKVNISVLDYYCPKIGVYSGQDLINYKQRETNHMIDIVVSYKPFDRLPLNFSASSALYGADLDQHGDQRYSSYFETKYNFNLHKSSVDVFMGLTNGDSFYDEDFSIINLGVSASRTLFSNNNVTIPIKASIVGNPSKEKIHLSFTISFS